MDICYLNVFFIAKYFDFTVNMKSIDNIYDIDSNNNNSNNNNNDNENNNNTNKNNNYNLIVWSLLTYVLRTAPTILTKITLKKYKDTKTYRKE